MLLDGMSWPLLECHNLKLTSLGSHLSAMGHYVYSMRSNALSGTLVHLPKEGVVCRHGEYKLGIYSVRGQCPASRGESKTVFLSFLLRGTILSSQ